MRDALIAGFSVFALILVSVGVGELAFAGYHQTFVGTAVAAPSNAQ